MSERALLWGLVTFLFNALVVVTMLLVAVTVQLEEAHPPKPSDELVFVNPEGAGR